MTTFNASIELNQSIEKQLAASTADFTTRTVEFLASEYGFDAKEAIQRLGLDSVEVSRPMKKKATPKAPKEKRAVPSFPLPFCGAVKEDWCCGLRLNHGLYSQCTMAKDKEGEFCKTCAKQADKNETNKPTHGVIQDRMAVGAMEFRDPKGKQVVSYGNVLKKLKIEKETAIAEAAKFGLVIAEEQFEERVTTRGRPKKDPSASDSDSEKTVKKRGRPKMVKTVVSADACDDLVLAAMKLAQDAANETNDGAESDGSVKSATSVSSVKSTGSMKAKKAKVLKPELTDEEKAAKKAATSAKRAETKAANLAAMTDEEKEAKKAAASAKRAATLAAKKAKTEAEAPAAIIGVTVSEAPIVVEEVAPIVVVVEEVKPQAAVPVVPVFQAELVEEDISIADSDSDEEMTVVRFTHDGMTYLRAVDESDEANAVLYDTESNEPVGVWNDVLNQVDALPDNYDE